MLGLVCFDTPDRVAIITEAGQAISYSDLKADIERVSQHLRPRELTFIIGRNDYPTVLLYLSALSRGTVPLLLNGEKPVEHYAELIKRFAPQSIFCRTEMDGFCPSFEEGAYTLYQNLNSTEPRLHPDLAYLAATSGSTGEPKLVRHTLNNLVSNAAAIAEYLDICPDDRALASLPVSYSYGLSVVNSHLYSGASIVLTNSGMMEKEHWALMREHETTSFAGVPYHYEMLLRLKLARLKLPALAKMTQAGGRLDPENILKVQDACEAEGIKFWTMYGQTEASPRMSYLPPQDIKAKPASIGKAIPGGRLWVEGENTADITQSGQVGELVYEGPNVCMGYAHSAEDLALGDENHGILRTGDLARADADGHFYIEGRLGRFLKIYGNRISLDQIERFVQDKGYDCAAHGWDDHLIVEVVDIASQPADDLRHELAIFADINTSAIDVTAIADLPRLETGKVDYQCLMKKHKQP
ncbi:AMP-binding protein [Magnetovibrio sp. PR-2]|uniref:AMP-binding protein n=1 Tax=Magnetovibrio sp. PR-2 TaxID=3120356 RepID=UPI002FCE5532